MTMKKGSSRLPFSRMETAPIDRVHHLSVRHRCCVRHSIRASSSRRRNAAQSTISRSCPNRTGSTRSSARNKSARIRNPGKRTSGSTGNSGSSRLGSIHNCEGYRASTIHTRRIDPSYSCLPHQRCCGCRNSRSADGRLRIRSTRSRTEQHDSCIRTAGAEPIARNVPRTRGLSSRARSSLEPIAIPGVAKSRSAYCCGPTDKAALDAARSSSLSRSADCCCTAWCRDFARHC